MAQTVVVLIPGITGTQLLVPNPVSSRLPPLVVWPDLVALTPGSAAKLLSRPDIYAGAPIKQIIDPLARVVTPVYSGIINYFTNLGYTYVTENEPLPSTSGNVLVGFGYDWRQPNRTSAGALNTLLGNIAARYGGAGIWLVGHSMGGLVSRYLLESGQFTNPSWNVQGLITLGTPHLGAPLALSAITGQCDVSDLLNPSIIESVVDLPDYPSGFELLPPAQVSFVTDATSGSAEGIYAPPVSTLLTNPVPGGFGAPATSLTDAQGFFGALNYGSAQAGRPPYYLAYGSGLDTLNAFTYDSSGASAIAQLPQTPPAGNAAGDGIVPQSSATFPGGWVTATYNAGPVKHGQLPSDPGTLAQVTAWMNGTSTGPAGAVPAVEAEPALVG